MESISDIQETIDGLSDYEKKLILNASHNPKSWNTILRHAKIEYDTGVFRFFDRYFTKYYYPGRTLKYGLTPFAELIKRAIINIDTWKYSEPYQMMEIGSFYRHNYEHNGRIGTVEYLVLEVRWNRYDILYWNGHLSTIPLGCPFNLESKKILFGDIDPKMKEAFDKYQKG